MSAIALFSIWSCGSGFPNTVRSGDNYWNSACPVEFEEVVEGAFCAPANAFDGAEQTRPICDYEQGYCHCAEVSCNTPQGPAPGCKPHYAWTCTQDTETPGACPFSRHEPGLHDGQPCSGEGTICSYDAPNSKHTAGELTPGRAPQECFQSFACKSGSWRLGETTCRTPN